MNQRVTSMRKLLNPLTKEYQELKKFILSDEFPWYIHQETVVDCKKNLPNWAYTHMILNRPEINRFAQSFALKPEEFVQIASRILELNGYKEFFFLRMCVNSTHPQPEKQRIGGWHTDHPYKHHNLIIYLTPTDGGTYVENQLFKPMEDDAIVFDGAHAQVFPTDGRRVVLVATFLELELDDSDWKERCVQYQEEICE